MTDLQPVTFGPIFDYADVRERMVSPNYTAVWLENVIEPDDDWSVAYKFIAMVFSRAMEVPVLFVTAEKNVLFDVGCDDDGSHFLCLFDADGHHNFGISERCANADEFRTAALELITERTGEPMTPDPEASTSVGD